MFAWLTHNKSLNRTRLFIRVAHSVPPRLAPTLADNMAVRPMLGFAFRRASRRQQSEFLAYGRDRSALAEIAGALQHTMRHQVSAAFWCLASSAEIRATESSVNVSLIRFFNHSSPLRSSPLNHLPVGRSLPTCSARTPSRRLLVQLRLRPPVRGSDRGR